jgi:hypothetical protein
MKNGNGSNGSDAAWVDYIVFPPSLATTIYAGDDALTCGSDDFGCQGEATNYQSVTWSTDGSGTFDNPSSLNAVYTPSAEDIASGSVNLSLSLLDVNGEAFADGMTLTIIDVPAQPGLPAGDDNIVIDNTFVTSYTVTAVEDATSYLWILEPADAGTFAGEGTTATVVWDRDYAGTAYVSVIAINGCGESIVSNALEITVENSAVGLNEPGNASFAVKVYPNPANEWLNIEITGENANGAEIRLVDLLGNVIALSKGYNSWRVPVNHLAPGIYILVTQVQGIQVTRKVIIR